MSKFSEILKEIDRNGQDDSINIYNRLLIGVIGIFGAIAIAVLAPESDKLLSLGLILFPVFPVTLGILTDASYAKKTLSERSRNEVSILS